MKKRNSFLLAAIFVAVTLLFSCKSTPESVAVDPITLIDRDAALYLFIPVQSHLPLIQTALVSLSGMDEKDAERIASRTETIYIAEESTKNRQIFQLSAKGSYPQLIAKMALTQKNGWTAQVADGLSVPYTYYKNPQSQIQLSLPSSANAIVSYSIEPQLAQYDAEAKAKTDALVEGTSYGGLPADFDKTVYEFLTTGNPNEIRFYERKADAFLQNMLGTNLKLPLKSVSGTLANSKAAGEYDGKLILEVTDATPAKMKALIAGLKIALFPMPAKIQQTGSSRITITDISLSQKTLVSLISQ